jgi:hypothetical protein
VLEFVRLSTVAPDLVSAIQHQSPEVQDALSMMIAEWVVEQTKLADARIAIALVALRAGGRGDSPERTAVQLVSDEWDELAWNIQEKVELGDASLGQYETAFDRSRAASAVWFALGSDPAFAAFDTLYEAQAAAGADEVRRIVYGYLNAAGLT